MKHQFPLFSKPAGISTFRAGFLNLVNSSSQRAMIEEISPIFNLHLLVTEYKIQVQTQRIVVTTASIFVIYSLVSSSCSYFYDRKQLLQSGNYLHILLKLSGHSSNSHFPSYYYGSVQSSIVLHPQKYIYTVSSCDRRYLFYFSSLTDTLLSLR